MSPATRNESDAPDPSTLGRHKAFPYAVVDDAKAMAEGLGFEPRVSA